WALLLLLTACGRLGFDSRSDASTDGTTPLDVMLVADAQQPWTGPVPIAGGWTNLPGNAATISTPPLQFAAGDFIVVAVGWRSAQATISSITSSTGITYTQRTPIEGPGTVTQVMYTSVASMNAPETVFVDFGGAVPSPSIRILSYRNATMSVPTGSGATGNGALATTGVVTTNRADVMLVAALSAASPATGPGVGFTIQCLTNPSGDVFQDMRAPSPASYQGTAPLTASAGYIGHMLMLEPP
ncbi:MAG TPA: hypothetical protein VMZ53_07735, partial [Kofleriaceae bacterium]|nr:hypothetical protein [Kofleriaceae bacterium]